jgi:uridine kinase
MGFTVSFKDMASIQCEFPLTAREMLAKTSFPKKDRVVACRVNHVQRPLSWTLDIDSEVDFIATDSIEGIEVYARSLMFMLCSAANRVCGIRLHLTQSMNYSYYFENPDGALTEAQKDAIHREMRRMVNAGTPFVREVVSLDKARAIMRSQGYYDKEALMKWVGSDPVVLYRCEGIYDIFEQALADTASLIPTFDLHLYEGGIFLSGPTLAYPDKTVPFKTSGKTLKLFQSYSKWLANLDLRTMDRVHELVAKGRSRDLIMLSEALHTKVLSDLANNIEERPGVRLLCLAGPSSSGKTTSSRRLRVQLLSAGIRCVTIELDNYFVNRDKTPRDADGNYDFEALEALDVDLINEHLVALIEGKEIEVPKFDFLTGKRTKGYKLRVAPNQIIVIEGIHGLNEKVSEKVPQEQKYGIFICPLTGTNIDMHNRIGTTDTRLLRRMVRDARTRGHSPEATLLGWPSVVRGSHRHIFPYQERADALFNTALAYELPVIKGYATPLLKSVPEGSPVYGEAQRLLSILSAVPVIPSDDVPNTSIFREFIGGSCFE